MTAMRVTHRLPNGERAVEVMPGVFCIEGRKASRITSAAAMSKFDVVASPDNSSETVEVTDALMNRAQEVMESLQLDADILRVNRA